VAVVTVAAAVSVATGCAPAPPVTGSSGTAPRTQPGSTAPDPQASPPFPCPAVADAAQAQALGVVHAFSGADGAALWGSLNVLGSTIYGRTLNGGAEGAGTLFAVAPDGAGFRVVHSFPAGADNGEGSHPRHDAMWWDGTSFWGTLMDGGRADKGAVFRFDPAAGTVTTVRLNDGAPTDGWEAHSGVVAGGDGALYGMTAKGGEHDKGAIVRLDPATGASKVVHSFEKKTGDDPHGRLTLGSDGRTLFGMTRTGGKADTGVVFSFDPATSRYTVLHEFGAATDATNGATADHGYLTVVGDQVWGLTADGGEQALGTLFRIGQDGSGFTILHHFGAGADGKKPHASLTQHGDFLYSTAITGGAYDRGTVWRVRTDGTGYETLASLDGTRTGGYPKGNVTFSADGATMFGTTIAGGAHDSDCTKALGTVFSLATPAPGAAGSRG
jgi:uncharacterized repeat protein (TIGR03803 family)